jgi:hypothetical protein
VGLEEGLAGMTAADASTNWHARGYLNPVMDLHEAHLLLRAAGQPIDIEAPTYAFGTQVWGWMGRIMRAKARKSWRDLGAAQEYARHSLGRHGGDTFLTEVSPIPRSGLGHRAIITDFRQRLPELERLKQERRNLLLRMLYEEKPERVICYGLGQQGAFERFLDVQFVVQDRIGRARSDQILLLPFLGLGHMTVGVIEQLIARGLL